MPEVQDANSPVKTRRRLVVAGLALAVALVVPVFMLAGVPNFFGRISDLPEYYVAAKMVQEGQPAAIYDIPKLFARQKEIYPQLGDRGIVLYIPPFSFLLLLPLVLLPAQVANNIWIGFLAVCAIASTWLLARLFKLSLEHSLWLAAWVAMTAPVNEALRISQIAPIMMLALSGTLVFLKKNHDWLAGLCLAVLLLKPQELAPLVLFLFCACRWRTVIAVVAVFGVLTAMSFLLPDGLGMYKQYASLLSWSSTHTEYMQPELSATVRGQLLRLPGLERSTANLISYGFLAAAYLAIGAAGWRSRKDPQLVFDSFLLIALPLGLITALHCHDYDLLLVIPSVVALANCEGDRLRQKLFLAAILLTLPWMMPFYIDMHYNYLLATGGVLNPMFFLFLSLAAVLIFAGWSRKPQVVS